MALLTHAQLMSASTLSSFSGKLLSGSVSPARVGSCSRDSNAATEAHGSHSCAPPHGDGGTSRPLARQRAGGQREGRGSSRPQPIPRAAAAARQLRPPLVAPRIGGVQPRASLAGAGARGRFCGGRAARGLVVAARPPGERPEDMETRVGAHGVQGVRDVTEGVTSPALKLKADPRTTYLILKLGLL